MGFTVSRAALLATGIGFVVGIAGGIVGAPRAAVVDTRVPQTLCETGLYEDCEGLVVAESNRPFTPQYPLWTDGAAKQRWIALPAGHAIDGSQVEAWQFPVGTRLWKQFSFGRRTETRYMVRASDGWRYATYVWSEDGTTATLAPARGIRVGAHVVPSDGDCRACHANGPTPVLGFSALQLSPDRDPGALHAERPLPGSVLLTTLVASGQLSGHRGTLAPRIAARTPTERSALGYLHGNCSNCHRAGSPLASLGMLLTADHAAATTVDVPGQLAISGSSMRIARGAPDRSVLLARVASRAPALQMPPVGTQVVDDEAISLLTSWIYQLGN